MIKPEDLYRVLSTGGVSFFTGVPDSLLKPFCSFVNDSVSAADHVITANEGGAVALAIGYHMATGNVPLVYMQNSGLGNTVNPLLSLADPEVYSIPMILLIGWRGEPGVKDEPQHVKQGKVSLDLLESMEIDFDVLDGDASSMSGKVSNAVRSAVENNRPYALVAKKGIFEKYEMKNNPSSNAFGWNREDAVKYVADALDDSDIVVSTTGMASRELFEHRARKGSGHHRDFLTVGGMGHASQIALGIALKKPDRRVFCIDGDGAALMHLGGFAIAGTSKLKNFRHIVINNGAHDSVGGQSTVAFDVDLMSVAKACCYRYVSSCSSKIEIVRELRSLLQEDGPSALEIRVDKGHRKDLGRPTVSPVNNKADFMEFLSRGA